MQIIIARDTHGFIGADYLQQLTTLEAALICMYPYFQYCELLMWIIYSDIMNQYLPDEVRNQIMVVDERSLLFHMHALLACVIRVHCAKNKVGERLPPT